MTIFKHLFKSGQNIKSQCSSNKAQNMRISGPGKDNETMKTAVRSAYCTIQCRNDRVKTREGKDGDIHPSSMLFIYFFHLAVVFIQSDV